jgi:hypothetical protein
MRKLWQTTSMLGLAVLMTACGTGEQPSSTPSTPASTPTPAPVPTPTPAPAPTPAATYTLKLSWTAPNTRANGTALRLSDISGYRLYYMREGSDAADDTTVTINGGTTTNYTVTLSVPGSYTFALTAVDANGLESPLSTAVSVPVN